MATPPNDSAKAPEQQRSANREFLDNWRVPRGIEFSEIHFAKVSSFIPEFKFLNYGYDGEELPELAIRRNESGYRVNKGVGSVIYSPHPDAQKRWEQAEDVWLAEGEGKTLALYQLGFPVLGFKGVRAWHLAGKSELHPVLAKLMSVGKTVHVVADADWRTNSDVRDGLQGCMAAICAFGGEPVAVSVPTVDGDAKTGIDDLIGSWKAEGVTDIKARIMTLPTVTHLTDDEAPRDFIPIDEVMKRPPPDWAIHGILMTGDVTTIVGPTACGKSFLTMDMLLAMSTGQEFWFGQAVRSHGLTFHITLEGQGMGNRANAYVKYHEMASLPNHYLFEQPVTLSDPKQTYEIIALLEKRSEERGLPIAAVAIDTVNRAMEGDENSAEAMRNFTSQVERIQKTFPKSAVIAIHHTGKDPKRGARGSSVLSANFGGELQIHPDDKTGIKEIWVQKVRDGKAQYSFGHFALDVVEMGQDKYGDPITSCVVMPSAPPTEPVQDIYGALHKLWTAQGSEPIPKSWFWSTEVRRTLRDEYDINLSRAKMEAYFNQTLIGENGLLIDQGRGAGGGNHYVLTGPKESKY